MSQGSWEASPLESGVVSLVGILVFNSSSSLLFMTLSRIISCKLESRQEKYEMESINILVLLPLPFCPLRSRYGRAEKLRKLAMPGVIRVVLLLSNLQQMVHI